MYQRLNSDSFDILDIDILGANDVILRNDRSLDFDDVNPLIHEEKKNDQKEKYIAYPLSLFEILVLNMMYMGLNMLLLLLSVEIVPAQVEAIVGSGHKGVVLGATVALGALFTFIVGPLVAMKSDRLTSRFGRRRPIIVICIIILCLSCFAMVAIAPAINTHSLHNGTNSTRCTSPDLVSRRCKDSIQRLQLLGTRNNSVTDMRSDVKGRIWLYVPLYLIVITSYVATITPYNALIADKSHPDQRGLSSGAMAGMILLGNIFGAALGLLITPFGALSTVSLGLLVLVLSVTVTITQTSEIPITAVDVSKLTCQDKIKHFWLPLKEHDFRWLFITRFLLQQGLTSVIGFLEYWVKDMIVLPKCWSTYKGVSYLLLPMLISAALSSVVSGIISDRINKRKRILIVTSCVMSIVAAIMSALSGPNTYYLAMCLSLLFGMALGGYQAVDFALLLDIIPNEKDKSLMIAVWHQAMILPQALAVPIAGVIVDLFEKVNCQVGLGYIILMLLISFYFLLGGCLINKMRNAK